MRQLNVGNSTYFIPGKGSPCELWKSYYENLKKSVGRDNAKTIWLVTWAEVGAVSCTTNADFNKWLKRHDMDVSNASTRAIADLSGIGGNLLGLGKNMTKIVSVGAPILLGGTTLLILILLINTFRNKDLSDLAMLTPAGRATKLSTQLLKG